MELTEVKAFIDKHYKGVGSMERFAHEANVSITTVYRWTRGENKRVNRNTQARLDMLEAKYERVGK